MDTLPEVQQNPTDSDWWTLPRRKAVKMDAAGRLRYPAIARKLGIDRTTLWEWRRHPGYKARLAEYRKEIEENDRRSLGNTHQRLRILDKLHRALMQIITERASDPEMQGVSGGKTGLIQHRIKGVGGGDDFQLVDEYVFDAALFDRILDLHERYVEELGDARSTSEAEAKANVEVPLARSDQVVAGIDGRLFKRQRRDVVAPD